MEIRNSIDWNSLDLTEGDKEQQLDSSIEPDKTPIGNVENLTGFSPLSVNSKPLVLVADDDPMVLLLAQQTLELRSFEVIKAVNGKEALELFSNRTPDLVLCDVMMPEMDGFDLCESIRALKQGKHLPIVMLTGLNDAKSIKRAFSVGATDFCEKPVNWELLPYKLNYILRASSTFSELRESEERYSLVSRGTNDGIWDWDLKNNRVYFSPRWKSMLEFTDDDIGTEPEEWLSRIHEDDKRQVIDALDVHKRGQTMYFESEYRIKNFNGQYRWMMCRSLAVRDEQGIAYRMTGSQTDITQRKEAEEKLVFDALHDALTGLPNRVLFFDRLKHCIDLSSRRNKYNFAVLYMDLNRFKIINDSLGHLLGDKLLIEVALRFKTMIRKGDTLARLGGDEFAILCEDIEDVTTVTSLAERLQKQLMKPVDLDGQKVVVGCSIGITESSIGYNRPEDMLRDADAAMYRAKARSGACYELFDLTMHQKVLNVLQTESDLRVALEMNEFEVHYQPIIMTDEGAISGFEALIRWKHPLRGMLVPDDFLNVAIESRLIVPMGRWILSQACQQLKDWKEQWKEAKDWTISVNLSAPELAQPDLITAIDNILIECGLAPNHLKLEITESTLIENSTHALHTMNTFRERGIQLSIDDFGTGYSSFNYLHQFPFDELKIDKTFIKEIDSQPDKHQIVNTIVSLAHNLGMKVVAEGSESNIVYDHLRELSCEYVQGFSVLKPKSAADIMQFITANIDPEG